MPLGTNEVRGARVRNFTYDEAAHIEPMTEFEFVTGPVTTPGDWSRFAINYPRRFAFTEANTTTINVTPTHWEYPEHTGGVVTKAVLEAIAPCAPFVGKLHASCGVNAYAAIRKENGYSRIYHAEYGTIVLVADGKLPKHVVVMHQDGEMFRHIITDAPGR